MKQNKKLLCLLLTALLLLSGCGSGATYSISETTSTVGGFEMGSISRCLDEDSNIVTGEYTGGEMTVDYYASGSGDNKDFGILLFLDGVPQPFYTDSDSEVAYIHYFSIEEDYDTIYFTLHFTPVTGQAGDTLSLSVSALQNAQYQPEMEEAVYFFTYYNNTLECQDDIHFAATPETADWTDTVEAMTNVSVTTAPLTEETKEHMTSKDYEEEYLSRWVHYTIYYDDNETCDNLDVTGKETVHITVVLCGGSAGVTYCVTCYANHHVLTDGENVTQRLTIGEDEVATLEFDLEVSQLEDLTTFYTYICPVTTNDRYLCDKTQSILLYQNS